MFANRFRQVVNRCSELNRHFSTTTNLQGLTKCELKNRAVIKLTGAETSDLLQGLITNDINHLESPENSSSIYGLFLNIQGRILFDTFITKVDDENFFVDCDASLADKLTKHLKMYKVRRKIDIAVKDELSVTALRDPENVENLLEIPSSSQDFPVYRDFRVKSLGFRMISSDICLENVPDFDHRELLYSLGVSEGAEDIPIGKCFPLEYNGDFMHGISFHKGCYIGQELTARIHHTGVIRKRIMPLELQDGTIKMDSVIVNEKGKNVGKVRGFHKRKAIGLIRIEQALESQELKFQDTDISLKVEKPDWWPQEAPKTRQNI